MESKQANTLGNRERPVPLKRKIQPIKANKPTQKDSGLVESSTGHCSDPIEFSEDGSWSGDRDLCNPKYYRPCQKHRVELSSSDDEVQTEMAQEISRNQTPTAPTMSTAKLCRCQNYATNLDPRRVANEIGHQNHTIRIKTPYSIFISSKFFNNQ